MKSKKKAYKEARSKLTFTLSKKKHENLNTLTRKHLYTSHTHTSEEGREREGGNGYLCAIYSFFLFFFVVLQQKPNLNRIFPIFLYGKSK